MPIPDMPIIAPLRDLRQAIAFFGH